MELFFSKIPLGTQDRQEFFSYNNMKSLHKATIARFGKECELKEPLKRNYDQYEKLARDYLKKHPIFDYFADIPLVISIIAPLAVQKNLTDIFDFLATAQSDSKDFLTEIHDGSLLDCLEFCTNYFENKKIEDPTSKTLDIWFFIGT